MQFLRALVGDSAGLGSWMNPCRKQRFVRINIPNTAYECLVQQQRLYVPAVAPQPFNEIRRTHRQCVGPGSRQKCRRFRKKFYPSELPDIVINHRPVIKLEYRSRVLRAHAVPKQFSGHPQVYVQNALGQFEEDLFAAPAHAFNRRAPQSGNRSREIAARNPTRRQFDMQNSSPQHMRRDRANNCFNFW